MRRIPVIVVLAASMALATVPAQAAPAPQGPGPRTCTQFIRAESPYLDGGMVRGRVAFDNSVSGPCQPGSRQYRTGGSWDSV